MLGGGITVKVTPLLFVPFTRTTTPPVTALDGTGTAILVLLQLVGMPVTPLPPLANVTVLVPCVVPKFCPLIVRGVPTGPDVDERVVMHGPTVNVTALLSLLFTRTTTGPLATHGAGAWIRVSLQVVGVTVVPLNVMVLLPRLSLSSNIGGA